MKSGRYFFILFLILLIMPAYAQKGVDITGTVIEEGTNEPIEQATVRLLSVKSPNLMLAALNFALVPTSLQLSQSDALILF